MIKIPSLSEFLYEDRLDKIFEDSISLLEKIDFQPSEADIVLKLQKAIQQRYYVGFYYSEDGDTPDNVKSGYRFIEAYTLGKGYKSGSNVSHANRFYLRGYLIKSTKKSETKKLNRYNRKSVSLSKEFGGTKSYRLFRIDRIKSLEVFKLKLPSARAGYNPNDSMMGEIIETAQF